MSLAGEVQGAISFQIEGTACFRWRGNRSLLLSLLIR